jgi:hypothetical protein
MSTLIGLIAVVLTGFIALPSQAVTWQTGLELTNSTVSTVDGIKCGYQNQWQLFNFRFAPSVPQLTPQFVASRLPLQALYLLPSPCCLLPYTVRLIFETVV